ncbi:MAG TPA: hypothetical protein VE569_00345 [Acidimicrobiia bacterium]|nr:hypothetical protein [Acidimicrobiia bacterium]
MAVNPDPKSGRWILPLVILGMIAFTYYFVRQLPEASTPTSLVTGSGSTTTTTPTGAGNGATSTTPSQTSLDPATQAYLNAIDGINTELQLQRTELVTVNEGFNNDREIEFDETETRFEAVATQTHSLDDQLTALTPPAGLEENHATLLAALDLCAVSADEALDGLRSTDTGERRNTAVDSYVQSATDYDTQVTNTHNDANANA